MAGEKLQYSKTEGKANPKKGNAANASQVTAMVMQEAQRRGMQWFKQHHALGMVGSFVQETGNFRKDVLDFDVRGDGGTAHGLMQWRGPRFKNLMTFAKQRNADPRDLRVQVAFAFEEGNPGSTFKDGGSIRALNEMSRARNVQEATIAFIHAERPAGYKSNNPAGAHDAQKRISHAMKAGGMLGKDGVSDSQGGYTYSADAPLGEYGTPSNMSYDDQMGTVPNRSTAQTGGYDFASMINADAPDESKVSSMVNASRQFADNLFSRGQANPFDFKSNLGAY